MRKLITKHQLKEYYGGQDNHFLDLVEIVIGQQLSMKVADRNIAEAISSGTLIPDQLKNLPDDEIKKELIKIKGIGPWSAEMFLMFSMKRPDIFSVGDLGLRTAIEKLYGISRDNQKAILELSESWRPHRSLASRLLWASLDNI